MRYVNTQERTIRQFVSIKKQIDANFQCICPVIDEFHYNNVKEVVDPRGVSRQFVKYKRVYM